MPELNEILAAQFDQRPVVTTSVFVTSRQKAAMAAIQPLGMRLLGSKRYTESATIRALVDILEDLHIDWETELKQVEPSAKKPREVLRTIIERHLTRRFAAAPVALSQEK